MSNSTGMFAESSDPLEDGSNNTHDRRPPTREITSVSSPLRPGRQGVTSNSSTVFEDQFEGPIDTVDPAVVMAASADAATAAAAAMLGEAAMLEISQHPDQNEDNDRQSQDHNLNHHNHHHQRRGTTSTEFTETAPPPSTSHSTTQQHHQPKQRPPVEESNATATPVTANHIADNFGKSLLTRAANIMRADNAIDTEQAGSSGHARVPNATTAGVASDAIQALTLDERPRFSVIDDVVGKFVDGYQELERTMHLEQTKTDRNYLSRLAELQTRLLIEGDLGLSGGVESFGSRSSVLNGDEEDGNNAPPPADQYDALARDELLMSQLELHQGQVNDLVWNAMNEKGQLQQDGARNLMDHAVLHLKSTLEQLQYEGREHAKWLKKMCDAKIGAARAVGDTAYKQAERNAHTLFEYKLKRMRRLHADEIMDQEDTIGINLKKEMKRADHFENKFKALERAQNGYMNRITDSENRATKAEQDCTMYQDQARIALSKYKTIELECISMRDSKFKNERKIKKLNTRNNFMVEKIKKLETKNTTLESDLAVRGAKLMALEEAIASQNVNTAGVADKVKAEKEKQRLREIEVETLRNDCQTAKIKAVKAIERAERSENLLINVRKDRDALDIDCHHLTHELQTAEEKLAEYEVRVSKARREADDIRVQMVNTSKHHRRMSVQLNERVIQAHKAVSNVVQGMSAPPPDFDSNAVGEHHNELLMSTSTNELERSSVLMNDTEERPWSPPNGKFVADVAVEIKEQTEEKEDNEEKTDAEAIKNGEDAADATEAADAADAAPPKQRTYEEIMWDRGAKEREEEAEQIRLAAAQIAEEKKQQQEEDDMMAALLANAEKAERAERKGKKKKSKKKSNSSNSSKKKKMGKKKGNSDNEDVYNANDPMVLSTGSRPNSAGHQKWLVLRKKAAAAMEHLKTHVVDGNQLASGAGGGSGGGGGGEGGGHNLVQMEKQLENELRENIETELRRKVQREFESKLKNGLEERMQRKCERKNKIALKKRIEFELAKIRLTPDETRDQLDYEKARTSNLEFEIADLQQETTALREEALSKDKGSAELALLVREKDMLLTEMTLLVRAYKEEVNIERAKVQASLAQPQSSRPHSRSSSRPHSSRPHSSKPTSSLPSSRSSRPQSRQRPQTANPIVRDVSEGRGGGTRQQHREFQQEQELQQEEERQMMAMRQVAPAPVSIGTSRDRVERMSKVSMQKRQDIAESLVTPGRRSKTKKKNRPTTAPLPRKSGGKASVLSSFSKKNRLSKKNVSNASKSGHQHQHRTHKPNHTLVQEEGPPRWAQQQPYIPSALIRTSLRDGFVHSSTVVGPDGIAMPVPLTMSDSAPQLHRQTTRPKSSPFIRFGSSGIQNMLERKKQMNK